MQQDCWQNGCHYRLSNRHGARKFSDIASEYKQQEKQEPQARPRKPVQGHPCFKQALGIPKPYNSCRNGKEWNYQRKPTNCSPIYTGKLISANPYAG